VRAHRIYQSFAKAERLCTAHGSVLLQLLVDLLDLPFLFPNHDVHAQAVGLLKDVAVGFSCAPSKVPTSMYAPGMSAAKDQLTAFWEGSGAAFGLRGPQVAAAAQQLLRSVLADID
jgi:hypothetical protein